MFSIKQSYQLKPPIVVRVWKGTDVNKYSVYLSSTPNLIFPEISSFELIGFWYSSRWKSETKPRNLKAAKEHTVVQLQAEVTKITRSPVVWYPSEVESRNIV